MQEISSEVSETPSRGHLRCEREADHVVLVASEAGVSTWILRCVECGQTCRESSLALPAVSRWASAVAVPREGFPAGNPVQVPGHLRVPERAPGEPSFPRPRPSL